MLPKDTEILLVQTYRALDAVGIALAVGKPGVEIADRAQTVATQCQRIGCSTPMPYRADIEGVLAEAAAVGWP